MLTQYSKYCRNYFIYFLINSFHPRPLLFYSVKCQVILLLKGEPLCGKGLTGPICPSLFLNSFPPKLANASPFVILLCLIPDYFILSNARTNSARVFSKVHPKITGSFFTYSLNKHHKTMTWDLKDVFPWLNVVLNIIRIVLYPLQFNVYIYIIN